MKVHNTRYAAIIQWHFHEYESAIEETEASLMAAETCPPPRIEASTIHCFVARARNRWPTANPGLARVHWRNFGFPQFSLLQSLRTLLLPKSIGFPPSFTWRICGQRFLGENKVVQDYAVL
jgi:hypothetical protein